VTIIYFTGKVLQLISRSYEIPSSPEIVKRTEVTRPTIRNKSKWMVNVKKYGFGVSPGFVWLRTGKNCWFFKALKNFEFHKKTSGL